MKLEPCARDVVRAFYDTCGWQRDPCTCRCLGELLHEDLDDVVQRYMEANELRYQRYFACGGRYFLDAGSGAEPRGAFGAAFRRHVCADISRVGLEQARAQLGARGLYVVCDLAALPFRAQSFDGVLASHCLYHVDRHLQAQVLREFYGVVRRGRNVVVFYRSRNNLLWLIKTVAKAVMCDRLRGGPRGPSLYSYHHDPARLARRFPTAEVTCLRTLTKAETGLLRKLHLLRLALRELTFLERKFPRAMVRVGQYVAIRIQRVGD